MQAGGLGPLGRGGRHAAIVAAGIPRLAVSGFCYATLAMIIYRHLPDPRALAEFYAQILGMVINEDIGDWVVIGSGPGLRELAFQRAAVWTAPRWPDPAHPQQMHLDIRVTDPDRAEQELLALGATQVPTEHETGFRVFTDPVGHPFCIVFGPTAS